MKLWGHIYLDQDIIWAYADIVSNKQYEQSKAFSSKKIHFKISSATLGHFIQASMHSVCLPWFHFRKLLYKTWLGETFEYSVFKNEAIDVCW